MNEPSTQAHEWRTRAILLMISLVVSFVGAELALRIVGIGTPKVREGTGGFTFFSHHPRLGWDLVPGASDRMTTEEMDVEIRITEQGLRAHRTFSQTPAPGTRRVMVLGDSFSFGHGVEVEEAWPARLETLLQSRTGRPTEVINLSVTGYGTDQQLMRFEDRGLELQPDTVILGLFVGNIFRNARDVQIGYPKPRFVLGPDGLEPANSPVPTQAAPSQGPSRLWHMLRTTTRTVREHLGYGEAWSVTTAILERLQRRCHDAGMELLVVVIPKDQVVYGQGWRRRVHGKTQERTDEMLRSLGIPFLDLSPVLAEAAAATETRLYFPIDGHWTAEGHAVAARAVEQALSHSDTVDENSL